MPKSAQTIAANAKAGKRTELDMQHGLDWSGEDLAGWIITEKFDGCRAYWDGSNLWSRGGICINIPAEWRSALVAGVHLDGEVYFGKAGLRSCATAVRYGKFLLGMQFVVFDSPHVPGNYLTRMNTVRRLLAGRAVIRVAETSECTSTANALEAMRQVQAEGGEGLMLRHPEIQYEAGRSRQLLKLKRSE